MLRARLIPCLDVKDGRVVKGVQFVDLVDAGDPVLHAQAYDKAGADELCFLDIAATHENRAPLFDIIERTASSCFIPLTVGGGVRTLEDIRRLLSLGADKVAINSAGVTRPEFYTEAAQRFGSQAIVAALDAKKNPSGRYEIFTHGGRKATGMDAIDFASQVTQRGAGEVLVTSMDKDGTGAGYDLELLKSINAKVNVPIIASGGAGSLDDLVNAIKIGGADAVLAASIFHFRKYSIAQAKDHLAKAGIPVR